MKSVSLALMLALSMTAIAQDGDQNLDSAYSFGGSCSSQGAWTQTALTTTQNLRRITLKLKNDPNCTSLGTNMQNALSALEGSVRSASDTDRKTQRMSQIPGELSALRAFAVSSPDQKKNIMKLMMDRSIEGATLSATVSDQQRMANGLMDLGSRVSRGAKTGVSLLNQVIDTLPQMDECLVGDGGQIVGNYLSATVKIAAAFGSSGQDSIGSQLATTISKLTNYARNKKFSKILRKLNQQEFMTSMSCLMELTSQTYCHARDGMGLFKNAMANLKVKKTRTNANIATNPYTGYYILNTHVPNITKWMQKIQVGVDPKLPSDADFKNKINLEVSGFTNKVNNLLADFNFKITSLQKMNPAQRPNAVLKLLTSISDQMTQERGGDNVNFFTLAKKGMEIPFFLIDMNQVPDQVAGRIVPQVGYDQWLSTNMESIPAFKDPLALAETIRNKMNALIREANIASIEYYNSWYIVDKAALVNESITDVNYTVKDSLKAIQNYLELAKERIVKYKGDASSIPIIVDTQVRIKTILKAFTDIEELGNKWKLRKDLDVTQEEILANANMYEKLINTVYEQFNVMNSKSGFLANRMVNFVYKDYDILIKNGVDFTPYQQELFYAEGMAAFDRMLQSYNGNPSNIQTDLNMALRVNGANLEALEMLLKDSMVGTISQLKLVADGKSSGSSVFMNSMARMLRDMQRDQAALRKRSLLAWVSTALDNPAAKSPWYWFKHSDRYPLTVSGQEDEYGSAAAVQSQLCIQALAFNDQNSLVELCGGTVLKSPFGIAAQDANYNKLLTHYLNDKKYNPGMRKALNYSERVCAFHDYNRKNMVFYMGLNKEDLKN
jgi:hypothetical protein